MKNEHLYNIQNEIKAICQAFNLGEYEMLTSVETSRTNRDYMETRFKADGKEYTHYYRVKNQDDRLS